MAYSRGLAEDLGCDLKILGSAIKPDAAEQFAVPRYEGIDFRGRQSVADEVRYIDGVKVAGAEESSDRRKIDVVGIAIVSMLPTERRNRRVGSLPHGRGLGADDGMLAV